MYVYEPIVWLNFRIVPVESARDLMDVLFEPFHDFSELGYALFPGSRKIL